jgi:DnaJ homolog subfamily C member 2
MQRVPFHGRRWIERFNAKLREAGKKEEKKRLKEFVEAAYRVDPRVAKQKEIDKLERCGGRVHNWN